MKGIAKFKEKVSYFSGKKIIFLPIYAIICVVSILSILFYFDFSFLSPIIPIISVFLMESIGLTLVFQMWRLRDTLKAKYPLKCYQKIFLVGFGGIIVKIILSIHNIIPLYYIGLGNGVSETVLIWSQPITNLFTINSTMLIVFNIIRYSLGLIIGLIGFAMIIRSIFTFGWDYMTVVYLYFPEESEVQNEEIYSVLRHPTYSGLIYISFAGILLQFSIYSIVFFIIYLSGFLIHIYKVEEKELIDRFKDGFIEYRKKTSAILVKPQKLSIFFRFLFGRKSDALKASN